jgi:diguanylate cyclase (GGDEF)-like protein/PAS domain S-box-containing protein
MLTARKVSKKFKHLSSLSITVAYLISILILVIVSDELIYLTLIDITDAEHINNVKHGLFLIVSSLFIYSLVYLRLHKTSELQHCFDGILDATSDGLIIADSTSGKIIRINPAAIKMLGIEVGSDTTQLSLKDLNFSATEYQQQSSQKDQFGYSNRPTINQIVNQSGEAIWVRISTSRVALYEQQYDVISVRDVTLRKQNEEVLRALAETSANNHEEVLKTIVKQVALSLNVRYALIGVLDSADEGYVNTLAVWDTDHFCDNVQYALTDTPCENIVTGGSCIILDGLQEQYPDDSMLVDMNAQGYFGVPLKDKADNTIGLLTLLHDKPMHLQSQTLDLLYTLAVRASIELERKDASEKLKLSSRVFKDTHEGIVITDITGTIIDVNPTFTMVTGYSKEEVIGQNPSILNSGKHDRNFYNDMWQQLAENGHWQGEIWNRKKNGETYVELLNLSSLHNDQGEIVNYVGIFTDITQSKQQQRQLELMAHYDVLTHLPNRVLFADRFKQASSLSHRTGNMLAICFLDLDGFKAVNDTYGHGIGDQLLIEVSKRIRLHIREEDTLSRQGGDEFALLLVNLVSQEQVIHMLERIQQAMSEPFSIDKHIIRISASMGVTLYPEDDSDLDTLLRHADQAMYQSKLAGKDNFHFFDIKDDQLTLHRHIRIQEVENALQQNQLQLYYQPKVNLRTGDIIGAEALIRWIHPEQGLIPPYDFLPLLEGSDLECQLGEWVIKQALHQMDVWKTQGVNLEISVNISPKHLQQDNFFDRLASILATYPNVDSNSLQLEILESSVVEDLSNIKATLMACRHKLGVNFALDDFGTGYSSLTHLRNLPVSTIKIDQSFIRNMLLDHNDYAIVDGVIGLSNSFNRQTIAEGVESLEHGLMLMLMGCELAQGYYIAKPLSVDHFESWLKDYKPEPAWLNNPIGQESLTAKQLQLCRLASKSWLSQFVKRIAEDTNSNTVWPVLESTKCHCSAWLLRERKENVIPTELLDKFEHLHDQMHELAQAMFSDYEHGNGEQLTENLTMLQTIHQQLEQVLDLMYINVK